MSRATRSYRWRWNDGQIAVVVLHALAHQGRAGVGCRGGLVVARSPWRPRPCVVQQRLEAERADAVGAARELHLDQAEVDPHLDLVRPVVAGTIRT